MHSRREVLAGLFAGVALTGCATARRLVGLPDQAVATDDNVTLYPFRREDIDSLGVPCLGVTLGDSVPGVMFLTRFEADQGLHWESANRYSLVTRAGRVIATKGLRRDLTATEFVTADPLQMAGSALTPALSQRERGKDDDLSQREGEGGDQLPQEERGEARGFSQASLVRRLDLVPGDHRSVSCVSRLEPQEEGFLTILEREYRALRVTEQVEVRRWQWKVENTYWLEVNTGQVIRSIQQISPNTPRIVIDLFKAPA